MINWPFYYNKIFCISFQRTGTTSVGKFFIKNGYRVATVKYSQGNRWSHKWFEGDYEGIFKSWAFRRNQVFEDDPWWCNDFYKILYHRFPQAKFVLLTRDADAWFNSMVTHSSGKTLGNTYMHSYLYGRLREYQSIPNVSKSLEVQDNLLPLDESHRAHYKEIYETRNQEILDFFERNDRSRLIYLTLEDPDKWVKLGEYFGIKVTPDLNVHENNSKLLNRNND